MAVGTDLRNDMLATVQLSLNFSFLRSVVVGTLTVYAIHTIAAAVGKITPAVAVAAFNNLAALP